MRCIWLKITDFQSSLTYSKSCTPSGLFQYFCLRMSERHWWFSNTVKSTLKTEFSHKRTEQTSKMCLQKLSLCSLVLLSKCCAYAEELKWICDIYKDEFDLRLSWLNQLFFSRDQGDSSPLTPQEETGTILGKKHLLWAVEKESQRESQLRLLIKALPLRYLTYICWINTFSLHFSALAVENNHKIDLTG